MVAIQPLHHDLRPRELRSDLDLSRERMARLVDVSSKTIERWEERESLPASARVRVQLSRLAELRDLGLTVYTPEGFKRFLRTPLPIFNGRTALHMVEQGETEQVITALAADYEGLGS